PLVVQPVGSGGGFGVTFRHAQMIAPRNRSGGRVFCPFLSQPGRPGRQGGVTDDLERDAAQWSAGGQIMDERFDVVVVGAGLAGLAAGATAAGTGVSTLILDGHPAGGRASTDDRGRYRFNRGPHALYRGGEAAAVLARLGVSTPGAVPPATGARGRIGDKVDVLPAKLGTLLRSRLLSVRGKVALARFLGGVKKWRPGELAGLTVGQWLDGFKLPTDARAFALFLVRTTTYANDEHTLSADVAAGQIQMALANNVLYLDGGWGAMVERLAATARR